METLLMYFAIIISQFVICAGIINGVELLKDIRDVMEEKEGE